MVRSFIVFLMLLVVFLAGMLLGVERGQSAPGSEMEQETRLQENNWDEQIAEDEQIEEEKREEAYLAAAEKKTHLTQKTASFLETVIKGFYDAVVQVLYQVSSLFF